MLDRTSNAARPLDRPLTVDVRIGLVVVVLVFSLVMQLRQENTASAAPTISYNCTTAASGSGHCYSMVGWFGAPGASTAIFTNQITAGFAGFVTNEIWLQNSSVSQWVEAGLQSADVCLQQGASGYYCPPNQSEFLFWGDVNDSGYFYVHPGPNLASSDFGKYVSIVILRTSATSNQYQVTISGLPVASLSGTSTNNSMSDDDIHIGGELFGSSGSVAPINAYTNNYWYDYRHNVWTPQGNQPTTNGLGPSGTLVMPPWEGYWEEKPSTDTYGGKWRTCISGAGC